MYSKYLVGEKFKNSFGTEFEITNYAKDCRHREIKFSLGDTRVVDTKYINKGNIFSKYDKTLHGVACIGELKQAAYIHPLYQRWANMVGRCYSPRHAQYKSYGAKGIYIEEYLLNFASYVNFVSSLENYDLLVANPSSWQIDKDKLGGGCYSRETISIISAKENNRIENIAKEIPVKMVNLDGTPVNVFKSISEAERITKIHRGNIARSVRTGTSAGGYKWEAVCRKVGA